MAVDAIEIFHVQGNPGILDKGLEPFLEQFGVHVTTLGVGKLTLHTRKGRFDASTTTRVRVSSMGESVEP
jgi:hypothetical protein